MSNESRAIRFAIAAAITLAAAVQIPQAAAAAKSPAAATPTAPASDEDKTFYALGVLMSRNLAAFDLTSAEVKLVEQGLTDGINHHPALDAEGYNTQLQTLQRTRLGVIDERQKAAGEAFLNKAAAEHGAQKTSTGMVFIPVLEGTGPSPERTDRVSVLYEGKLTDGTVFDSTAKHGGQPVPLSLGGVIPCWTEALQLMKVGGKSRVVCPSSLAYGDRGAMPTILPGSTLEFSIQLVEILPKSAAPAAGAPTQAAPDAAGGANGPK